MDMSDEGNDHVIIIDFSRDALCPKRYAILIS